MKKVFFVLVVLVACAKKVEKIDAICPECGKPEKIEIKETQKAPEKPPIIFEYDALKEELNVRTYEELFDRAMQFYYKGDIETAEKIFKVLAENSPNKYYREIALFNMAISTERLGNEEKALEIYEELSKSEDISIREDAILRAVRIKIAKGEGININPEFFSEEKKKRFALTLLILDRTEKILKNFLNSATFSLSITGSEQTPENRDEIRETLEELSENLSKIEKGIYLSEEDETKAVFHLCRGNIYFIKAVLTPNKDTESVKKKVKYLLDAQREYFSAVKTRLPWWMTAGVFKIGETYRYLFENIANSPVPSELKTEEEIKMYRVELVKELKKALDLAQNIYEKNIKFSQRAKLRTVWVTKSEEEMQKIQKYIELVQRFVDKSEREIEDKKE